MLNLNNYLQTGGVKKNEKLKDVYCGADKLPKGKKYGSIYDCHKKGQIRLWGRLDMLKIMLKEHNEQRDKIVKRYKENTTVKLDIFYSKELKKINKKIAELKKQINETEIALEKK